MPNLRIAVLVPCYNEAQTIANVVNDFKGALPQSTVYVYDNNSSDNTIQVAMDAGAIVKTESYQGKGNVLRRMFADIEADIYVVVDGDDTYDASSIKTMIQELLKDNLDMVVGSRLKEHKETAFRAGHKFGNRLLTGFVGILFRHSLDDMLSGYRVLSRRFVKSFPALAIGFETETELTIHALELRMPIKEIPTPYKSRPEGSESKLRTYRDGLNILFKIINLFREERPQVFFTIIFVFMALLSVGLGYSVLEEYFMTGLVLKLPTAVLSTGIMLLAFLSLVCGLILHTVTLGRREQKRLSYLSVPYEGSK